MARTLVPLMLLALLVTPAIAFAQPSAVGTTTATVGGYDVDFTLPTAAKAGCMVCHGDENLVRLQGDEVVSFWVDPAPLEAGPHATAQCVGCHLDFAFTLPHVQEGEDWQTTARSACKNCHEEQYLSYGQGVHRPQVGNGATQDDTELPLCGDCHGSHEIQALVDNPDGQQALRANAYEICGRCHEDYWGSYADAYHGKAFKAGAEDAPACWDCHGYHEIWPSSDRRSMVHESRISQTCTSGDGCHDDVSAGYLDYVELIHGQRETLDRNPFFAFLSNIRSAITGLFRR
ncbi:MAG: cytochrome c3 family protein [Coriobacteriia bacterium]|nr:cytochrome c3 family protein [Coriobacteriia bacterium]